MVHRTLLAVVTAALLAWSAPASRADVLLSLETEPSVNLALLTLGQTFRINVVITGINPGEVLEVLTASVLFDGTVFGTPNSIDPGPTIPDAADFLSFGDLGQADGALLAFLLPDNGISSDGVFYSFEVTVQAEGSGSISLDPLALSVLQYNPDNPNEPLTPDVAGGDPLDYVAIPEPGLGGVLGLLLLGSLLRRKRGGQGSVA